MELDIVSDAMPCYKVLIFVNEKLDFPNFKVLTEILGNEGIDFSIVSFKKNLIDLGNIEIFADLSLEELKPENYDCIILMCEEKNEALANIIKDFQANNKVVAIFKESAKILEDLGIKPNSKERENFVLSSNPDLFALKILEKLKGKGSRQ